MRNYKYIVLFFSFSTFSQSHIISQYEKYDYDKKCAKYYSLLNEDINSLLLKIDNNKFLIYKDNDEIIRVSIGFLSGEVLEKKIISKTKLQKYTLILDSLYTINPNLLNETTKKDSSSSMEIQDGTMHQLELFKSNYFVDYKSYAAIDYIKFKASFYEERIKFLNVIKSANKLYDEDEHEKLKNKDTIYLSINQKDFSKLKVSKSMSSNNDVYTFETLKNHFIYLHFNQNLIKVNKKKFLKKDLIIDLEYLNKYGLDWILNDSKKVIFVIQDDKLDKRNLVFKRASFK